MIVGGVDFRERAVPTREGFPLAVFDHVPGAEPGDAPPIVLVNGLGGNLITWRHLIRVLAPRHRLATWDYRGLYASRFDADTRAKVARGEVPLDPVAHADDALRVLDALGLERAVFIGWSMGVQLDFELARLAPSRVQGLVQICGAAGRTIGTTVFGKLGLKVIPPAMDLFRVAAERHGSWLGRVVGSSASMAFAKTLGIVAPSIDETLAAEIVRDYVRLDFDVYNRILMGLGEHDASDVLPALGCPVLIIAGTRDAMTPIALSRAMADKIPDAELVVIEGGSHYLPIEFPDRLAAEVERFLSRWTASGT